MFADRLPHGRRRLQRPRLRRRVLLQRGDDGHHRLRRDVPDDPRRARHRHASRRWRRSSSSRSPPASCSPSSAFRARACSSPSTRRSARTTACRCCSSASATSATRACSRRSFASSSCAPRRPTRVSRSIACTTSSSSAIDRRRCRARGPCCTRSTRRASCIGATPESLERDEVEIILTLSGTDELSAQHAPRADALRGEGHPLGCAARRHVDRAPRRKAALDLGSSTRSCRRSRPTSFRMVQSDRGGPSGSTREPARRRR